MSVCLSVCLSVRLYAGNNSVNNGRNFVIIDISVFLKKLIEKIKIYLKSDKHNS